MTASDSFGPLNGFPSPLAAPPGVSSFEIPDLDFICESIPDAACEPSKPQEGAASAVLGHKVQQVVLLDPRLIRPGTVPNRAKAAFDQALFRHLQASITLAGGNVQPIAVRPAPADEAGTVYEIIYGERRHRSRNAGKACGSAGRQGGQRRSGCSPWRCRPDPAPEPGSRACGAIVQGAGV